MCQLISAQMPATAIAEATRIARSASGRSAPDDARLVGAASVGARAPPGFFRVGAGARVACSGPNVYVLVVTSGAAGDKPVDLDRLVAAEHPDRDRAGAVGELRQQEQLLLACRLRGQADLADQLLADVDRDD